MKKNQYGKTSARSIATCARSSTRTDSAPVDHHAGDRTLCCLCGPGSRTCPPIGAGRRPRAGQPPCADLPPLVRHPFPIGRFSKQRFPVQGGYSRPCTCGARQDRFTISAPIRGRQTNIHHARLSLQDAEVGMPMKGTGRHQPVSRGMESAGLHDSLCVYQRLSRPDPWTEPILRLSRRSKATVTRQIRPDVNYPKIRLPREMLPSRLRLNDYPVWPPAGSSRP